MPPRLTCPRSLSARAQTRVAALLACLITVAGLTTSSALDLVLPTENDAIFTGSPEKFYMYVNRWDAAGVKSTPWEGGQYGFVRNPRQVSGGLIYTRFHGGIDIRPLHRDEKGNPLDAIQAIAPGRVVHVNPLPGGSNYGRYLVIEHQWDGCPYYSLYAHLGDIHVAAGAQVAQGDKIAQMGFTGSGIDRERAHVHLEITLLMNDRFDSFYNLHWKDGPNRHGNFNGINLAGINVAELYLQSRANPALTIPEFLKKEPVFFYVDLPGDQQIDMLERYPWMLSGKPATGGWRLFFSQPGIPLRVERLATPVSAPSVTVLPKGEHSLSHLTSGLVTGTREKPRLSASGQRLVALLTHQPQMESTATGE